MAGSSSRLAIRWPCATSAACSKALREEGCHVLDKTDASKYGKFGWVIDPEDNKVELWQAPDGR